MIRIHCDYCEKRFDSPFQETFATISINWKPGLIFWPRSEHQFCSIECLKKFVSKLEVKK